MIKRIVRGCGYLPHVGSHPGTEFVVGMIALGAIVGAAIMAVGLGPFYLYGAYDRARISERLSRKELSHER